MQTLLGDMKLSCASDGCTDVIGYHDFRKHTLECLKAEIKCSSCSKLVIRSDIDDHKVNLSISET